MGEGRGGDGISGVGRWDKWRWARGEVAMGEGRGLQSREVARLTSPDHS